MDSLLSAAHCKKELGAVLFDWVVSSNNTDEVRQFAERGLIKSIISDGLQVGDRLYKVPVLSFSDEGSVSGHTMAERAAKKLISAGEEDGSYLLQHHGDIPAFLRGRAVFVFPNWHRSSRPDLIAVIHGSTNRWTMSWFWVRNRWNSMILTLSRD